MKDMRGLLAGVALLLLAGAAAAADEAPKSAFDKSTLESYVRYMLMWGPPITVSISDPQPSELPGMKEVTIGGSAGQAAREMVLYISDDGQKIVQGNVLDVGRNPFQDNLDKITTFLQPSMGEPGAPVTLVVYSDFQCAYCKQEAEALRQNLPKSYPEQVRLYFKDFPLESIHPWSKAAAIAGRCVFNQSGDAFWDYHDWIFGRQQEITPTNLRSKLMEFAGQQGSLDTLQLGRCFDERLTEKDVDETIAEGRALLVNSTPTLFVNGRRFTTQVPWDNLRQIIDFELESGNLFGGGDEECCTVELPTPLTQ